MNILCYLQPHRGGGVLRHSVEMVGRLGRRPGVATTGLVSGREAARHPQFISQLNGLPLVSHPWPALLLERAWKACGMPALKRRCLGFDVIYSPAEVRFPACGIPRVITIHDVQALETDLPWSVTAEHALFRRKWLGWVPKAIRESACVATVSEFSKQRMVTLLDADPAKIEVIGNGVSAAFFRSPPQEPVTPTSVVVIGGLRTKKGAAATLDVATSLIHKKAGLMLDVFGQHEPEWITKAQGLPNVRLHDHVDDETLALRLANAAALLFLSPYEGFGIPAIEAMAAGAPAVVSNAAALPEVVGCAGIVVNPADAVEISDILIRLAQDQAWRSEYVARGKAHAAHFTWDACVDRLVTLFERIA